MMLRKVLSVLLAMVLLMGLTACGGGGATSDPADSSVSTSNVGGADATTTTMGSSDSDGEQTTTSVTGTGGEMSGTTANLSDKITTTTTKNGTTTTKNSTTPKTTNPDTNAEWVTVNGSSKNLKTWVYQLADSGIYVREARFDSGKGGDPATIIQLSDLHFTGINDKDRQEKNEALLWTYNKRKGAFPNSVANTQRCMDYASQFDQTIVTGDAIDYLAWGTLEQMQKYVWDKDPKALVTLGNHEPVRVMSFPDQIPDNSTLESRYAILESFWKHDIYYSSKVIKNKAMVIQMDNSQCKFWPEQLPKLKADIATAKKNGYVVLLFFHYPLNTGVAGRVQSFFPNNTSTPFNSGNVAKNQSEATKNVYDVITNNADVIKGVFCGDYHSNYYTEIKAKTSDGTDTVIPQYVLTVMNAGMGTVMKITVK